jgi:ectoine hydroxylase-related dioxygenase (phytanoyl-CoA dioxygenase family)
MSSVAIRQMVEAQGFALVGSGLSAAECDAAARSCMPLDHRRGGARNLLSLPWALEIAKHRTLREAVGNVLGEGAFPFKAILFDKSPASNWKVAWHQDVSLPVRLRRNEAGWGPWSVKAGVLHVQAPPSVLDQILAVRIHLDEVTETNAPLRVIPGSHLAGRMSEAEMALWRSKPVVTCVAARGSLLLMRPLLLYASSVATSPTRRRVLHIEFAHEALSSSVPELAVA